MDVPSEAKERIVAAANALYQEAGAKEFPTVAAVRARAGTDMNATSTVMREWRRSHTSQAAPVAVEIPEKLRMANGASLASLWSEAQALANESLQSAQAIWDADRSEAETLRAQLSEAFDSGRRELEAAQALVASQAEQIAKHQAEIQSKPNWPRLGVGGSGGTGQRQEPRRTHGRAAAQRSGLWSCSWSAGWLTWDRLCQ